MHGQCHYVINPTAQLRGDVATPTSDVATPTSLIASVKGHETMLSCVSYVLKCNAHSRFFQLNTYVVTLRFPKVL